MFIKQISPFILVGVLLITSACSQTGTSGGGSIVVHTRDEGSGTRSAFAELFDIYDDSLNENFTAGAKTTSDTEDMMSSVRKNKNAIGYIPMGLMDGSVKAIKIDGVDATADNLANGSYTVAHSFNLAILGTVKASAADFLFFTVNTEGQDVVELHGYIKNEDSSPYQVGSSNEKITVSGSTSMTPLMEALKEAYMKIHPYATIEILATDSSAGANDVMNNISDIAMLSRDLTDAELENGLISVRVAMDGIAVIVNNENNIDGLSKEQVKEIFTGRIKRWREI